MAGNLVVGAMGPRTNSAIERGGGIRYDKGHSLWSVATWSNRLGPAMAMNQPTLNDAAASQPRPSVPQEACHAYDSGP